MIRKLILVAITLAAMAYVLSQSRKPSRWVGRFFVRAMNLSHSGLTDWGLTHVRIAKNASILDIGCGGGRTLQKLAAVATEGRLYGVDFAPGSVAESRATNAAAIRAGRVEIAQASVSKLPYPDNAFDLVTAIETHYYWPRLADDMREVLRVVKPGGTLLVIAEIYKSGKHDWLSQVTMAPLRGKVLSAEEHLQLFSSAGFTDAQVFEERGKGWVCVTGRKP
jgi:ubiquinone/menaquinone biosynthesis C-methylase UbiE